eukprot:TRINITY_DN617_c0_g2_i6.p1 TRINITY_DN617_c0_g2~~TRINITY_DN617_c0_g2_i6.p1  ORF type:complete len:120 (+),score=5.15 TRINITY_DN617_c0_g2_i6:168-527(+)
MNSTWPPPWSQIFNEEREILKRESSRRTGVEGREPSCAISFGSFLLFFCRQRTTHLVLDRISHASINTQRSVITLLQVSSSNSSIYAISRLLPTFTGSYETLILSHVMIDLSGFYMETA